MAAFPARVTLAFAVAIALASAGVRASGTAEPVPDVIQHGVCDSVASGTAGTVRYATPQNGRNGFNRTRPAQDSVPRRIVSLVPATTEMLFLMGAGDRVVGVSNYDRFPPEVSRIRKVGGLLDPDVETLLSLRPDLVIVYDTQTDLKRQLERAQVPMYRYVHRGLADITETLRAIGARIGATPAANAAATRIEDRLAAVRDRVAGRRKPATLLVFGREPGTMRRVHASGGYGFLHDVLELAGGTDVLNDLHKQSVEMGTEMILTRRPEVVIELHYGNSLPAADLDAERRVWNTLPSLPAVKNNRVYLLTGDEFVVPGPRIVVAAERFAQTLHPQAR